MKKLLLLFAVVATVVSSASAQAPRRVLVEELTSSTCPPCATTDPIMEQFEADYLDKICMLKWHVNWPAPGNDPFYANYKLGRQRSIGYYENTGVPHTLFNGQNGLFPNDPNAMKALVDDAGTSPYTIEIAQTIEGDSIIANLTVKCVSTPPSDNDLRLAVVFAERFAAYQGTNGRPFHTSAVRTVVPGLTGVASVDTGGAVSVTAQYPAFSLGLNETKTYRYAAKIGSTWNKDQLMSVGFIQSVGSREIFQSNWTVPAVTITPKDKLMRVGSETGYEVEVHNLASSPIDVKLAIAPLTSPTSWNLHFDAPVNSEGIVTLDAGEIKPLFIKSTVGENYDYAPFTVFANSVAGGGIGGMSVTGLGKDVRDIIINAGSLSATKLGQVQRGMTDYGYHPVTFDYLAFDEAFAADWTAFRTILYLADNKNGVFSYTAYLPIARSYMEQGGNFLLSSSNLVGAYYDASVAQGNDIFITSMQDNFNLTPSESIDQTSWGQLEGVSGDPISDGLSAAITGMATTQRLTINNTNDGSPIFKNENGDIVGVRSVIGDGKMVFMSFGFDKIASKDSSVRKTAITKVLDWFAGKASVKVNDNASSVSVTNSPNPAQDLTTFTFSITEPSIVNLAVYDVMGREVAKLVKNESHATGTYEAEFDASHLSNGTYTYVLSTGSEQVSGTLVVQK